MRIPPAIREMRGTAKDACDPKQRAETQSSCYWDMHRPLLEHRRGRLVAGRGRRARIRRRGWCAIACTGKASQIDRPNERPFALHRNGYAGMQRYGSFLWSGDVNRSGRRCKHSRSDRRQHRAHAAFRTGAPISAASFRPRNCTGELYVRWFQFAAFSPLFRSHGRTWKLRLPWGWNTGETGPVETPNVPLDPEANCTTRRSSRSAASISNCATA